MDIKSPPYYINREDFSIFSDFSKTIDKFVRFRGTIVLSFCGMKINKDLKDGNLILSIEGEINSFTAPELEEVIKNDLNGVKSLVFDFAKVEYLSSAGLRILLVAQKVMSKQGKMSLRHVNSSVMEVLEITGFSNILEIED